MSFIKNIKGVVNKASLGAKKAIDGTKLEFKIKRYSKDITYNLNQIGLLVYEHKINSIELDTELINAYCNEIYNTKDILNNLQKRLEQIKSKETNLDKQNITKVTSLSTEQKENKKYLKLDRKVDDFKITRTPDGIKILKFCTVCNTGNAINSEECASCGNTFHETK